MTEKEPINMSFLRKLDLYAPLIFTTFLSFALGGFVTSFMVFTLEMYLMNSMGVFITILGVLKLRDIKKFAGMFIQYDPLAKKFPLYAKVYPYIETGVGLLTLASVFVLQIQLTIVAIYFVTTLGIISAHVSGKKLQCGCLGGGVTLPLSWVTIFENVIMIAMALFTIYSHTIGSPHNMSM